jgi:pyruvate formate lyase activating enzyme
LAAVMATEAGDSDQEEVVAQADKSRLRDHARPEELAQACVDAGARSIAFTYNDPVIFLEYAVDTAQACRARGIKTVAVSAGYIEPAARIEFFDHIDAVNIDLKAFSDHFYFKLASAHLAPVLETLKYIKHESDTWLEITTLLIPGENDSDDELKALSAWVARELGPDVPLHFSAFHPDYKMLDKPSTPHQTLTRARQIAQAEGLQYVYLGNVHDEEGSSTYCPGCGEKVIGRDWYVLSRWHLDHFGGCLSCGTKIAGRFAGPAGTWGAKRQPISLQSKI